MLTNDLDFYSLSLNYVRKRPNSATCPIITSLKYDINIIIAGGAGFRDRDWLKIKSDSKTKSPGSEFAIGITLRDRVRTLPN